VEGAFHQEDNDFPSSIPTVKKRGRGENSSTRSKKKKSMAGGEKDLSTFLIKKRIRRTYIRKRDEVLGRGKG